MIFTAGGPHRAVRFALLPDIGQADGSFQEGRLQPGASGAICLTEQNHSYRHGSLTFERNLMRNQLLIAAIFSTFIASALPLTSFSADTAAKKPVTEQDLAAPPDATIDYEAEQFRLILGGSSGKGTLHFKGKDYPFTMKGASVGGVGMSKVEG